MKVCEGAEGGMVQEGGRLYRDSESTDFSSSEAQSRVTFLFSDAGKALFLGRCGG